MSWARIAMEILAGIEIEWVATGLAGLVLVQLALELSRTEMRANSRPVRI